MLYDSWQGGPLKNWEATILNPLLKPHEIHLPPSVLHLRKPGQLLPAGEGRQANFPSLALCGSGRFLRKTRELEYGYYPAPGFHVPESQLKLLSFCFCPSQHCHHLFYENSLNTFHVPGLVLRPGD